MNESKKKNIAILLSSIMITVVVVLVFVPALQPYNSFNQDIVVSKKTLAVAEMLQANGTNWLFIGGHVYQSDNATELFDVAQGEP
jgi:hypothetical protein